MTVIRQTEKRKVLFLTGTRADFGKMKPLIARVEASDDFECHVFVTGMHMLSRYGSTVIEIQEAGFKNFYTYINQVESASSNMDLVLANTIQGLGYFAREFRPDLIVVHGDRVETLAGAIVGALNNILVAHIEGGEVTGTVDDLIRHSVSKLSHVHFVANDVARKRLLQMGEREESIYVVGSPDIDVMLSDSLPPLSEALLRYEIPFREYAIFMYHPVTTEVHKLRKNIINVVAAARACGWKFVVVYPNNDWGTDIILEAILPLKDVPGFRLLPSIRFEYFLTLLKNARAIMGNSSAGIREAPLYGVPTVNIGSRQMNRFHYPSIVNVSEDTQAILRAIESLPARGIPTTHFGRGESARLFIDRLQSEELWNTPRQKQFCDVELAGV